MHTNRLAPTLALAALTASVAAGGFACKDAKDKVEGVGDSLQAFIITEASTGERYCQVCAYSGRPTIMAVGDVDDEAFEKDLLKLQALVEEHGESGDLTAFALYGKISGGKFQTLPDEAAAAKKLAELKKRLGLEFPVTIVPEQLTDKERASYTPFAEAYDISKSRTVMVAKANNEIVFARTFGADAKDYDALAEAVKSAL